MGKAFPFLFKSIRNWHIALFLGGLFFFSTCSQESHYEARFPIDYLPYSEQPVTEVKIEENTYPLMVDLGSSSCLTLKTEIIEKIKNKEPFRSACTVDIKGNEYDSNVYLIPEVKVRNMRVRKVETLDEGSDFLTKGSLIYDNTGRGPSEIYYSNLGRIGRGLFENQNLLLDFHNSVMFACCHLNHRQKDGYRIDKMVQLPFEGTRKRGFIFKADTDLGPKKFMLDTGATWSLIKPSLVKDKVCEEWKPGVQRCHTSKFLLGGKNFGSLDLVLFEIAPSFEGIDGVIGMDFLKNHVVYLDFKKKIVHVGKASEVSSNIRVPSYVKKE